MCVEKESALTKAGAGRFLIAVLLALFTFASVASAKTHKTSTHKTSTHKTSKEQPSHRQSRAVHKSGKEHSSAKQSRIAHKVSKERPSGRQSRVARKTRKEQPASRHSRLAEGTSRQQPAERQSRITQRFNKEQPANTQSTYQIAEGAHEMLPEPKTSSVPQNTVQTQKPAEPQVDPDTENAVIPPAPVIVKRSAPAILIPVEVVGGGPKAKSDSKIESKYEERPAVASSVSVGSAFGYRRDPFTRRAKFHSGVDLKARWGDPVGASQAGTVQFAGWYHGYGNMIIVAHGGGVTTQYAHLSSFDVEPGTHVDRGTIIGRAGSTGRATSPHLHYEVRFEGTPISPFQPIALDASSDYFKQSRPAAEAGHNESTSAVSPQREK
jgi:murein DD-endopeptidase MepM/ murein hydrolase activator NlpD